MLPSSLNVAKNRFLSGLRDFSQLRKSPFGEFFLTGSKYLILRMHTTHSSLKPQCP